MKIARANLKIAQEILKDKSQIVITQITLNKVDFKTDKDLRDMAKAKVLEIYMKASLFSAHQIQTMHTQGKCLSLIEDKMRKKTTKEAKRAPELMCLGKLIK